MQPIFKTNIFINQSKANLNVKILFGKINNLLDQWRNARCAPLSTKLKAPKNLDPEGAPE